MKAEGELRRKRRRRAVKVRIDKMTISTAEFGGVGFVGLHSHAQPGRHGSLQPCERGYTSRIHSLAAHVR
jgi:hypothetical protein